MNTKNVQQLFSCLQDASNIPSHMYTLLYFSELKFKSGCKQKFKRYKGKYPNYSKLKWKLEYKQIGRDISNRKGHWIMKLK